MQPERSEEYTMGYLVGKVESMESSLAELRSLVTRGITLLVLTLLTALGKLAAGIFSLLRLVESTTPYCAVYPPSTISGAPVTNAASSDARNSAAFAISAGCPSRPIGCRPFSAS